MVAQAGVVAREAQDVLNAEHGRAQNVGLERDSVPVPAGQLVNRRQTGVQKRLAGGQAAQAHDGGLVVRHVDRRDAAEMGFGFLKQAVDMDAFGRADLRRHHKFPALE